MSQKKKQHYVPIFYLKSFSSDGKRIGLWNIQSKKNVLSASLKHQCYGNFFYGKNEKVENSLSDLESSVSKILRDIDQGSSLPPTWHQDYKILSRYIFTQFFRTESMIDELNNVIDQMSKYISNVVQNSPSPRINGHAVEEFKKEAEEFKKKAPEFSVADVSYSDRLKKATSDLESKLLINKTEIEFVTSDHPVVLYNQLLNFMSLLEVPGSRTGLNTKGLQVFFPISPTKLLFFYDPTSYQVGHSHGRNVPIHYKQEILDINVLQMCSANENIYFKNENFDIDDLYNRAGPYMKRERSNFNVHEGRESSVFHSSRSDINTNLKLSFIRITQDAKCYQMILRKDIETGRGVPIVPYR